MKKIKAFHQGTDLLNTKKVEIVNLSTYENIATVLCIERRNKKILMECHTFLPFFRRNIFYILCMKHDVIIETVHRACGVQFNSDL